MNKPVNITDIVLEEIIRKRLAEQSVIGAPNKGMVDPNSLDTHEVLLLTGILAGFIPVVGPFVSSGIMLADAALYAKEGDNYNAGLAGVFAALPMIGPVARLGTGAIGKLGKAGMAKLGSKVASAAKSGTALKVTPIERAALQSIKNNPKLVTKEADKYLSSLVKANADKIKKMAPAAAAAIKQTAKQRSTRVAAEVLGVFGAMTAYDWAYYKANAISSAEVDEIFNNEEGRIANHILSIKANNLQENNISSIQTKINEDFATEQPESNWFMDAINYITSAELSIETGIIGFAIFFGGRWILRSVKNIRQIYKIIRIAGIKNSIFSFNKYKDAIKQMEAKTATSDLMNKIKNKVGKPGEEALVLTKPGATQLAKFGADEAIKTIDTQLAKVFRDKGTISQIDYDNIILGQIGPSLHKKYKRAFNLHLKELNASLSKTSKKTWTKDINWSGEPTPTATTSTPKSTRSLNDPMKKYPGITYKQWNSIKDKLSLNQKLALKNNPNIKFKDLVKS
jgi:hypothetical protein